MGLNREGSICGISYMGIDSWERLKKLDGIENGKALTLCARLVCVCV